MKGLKGKVVFITGACSGIGKRIAECFAEEGSYLALNGLDEDSLKKVKDYCIAKGVPSDKVMVIVGDLTRETFCGQLVESIFNHFGKIDIFVCSSGVAIGDEYIKSIDMEKFDFVLNINLRVPCILLKLVMPYLEISKGNAVFIASILANKPTMTNISYCTSKGGLVSFCKSAAVQAGPKGVRINCVNPGVIDNTNIFKGVRKETKEMFLNIYKEICPLKRCGTPTDVAKMVLYLASDDASFVNGAEFMVDGGFSIGGLEF